MDIVKVSLGKVDRKQFSIAFGLAEGGFGFSDLPVKIGNVFLSRIHNCNLDPLTCPLCFPNGPDCCNGTTWHRNWKNYRQTKYKVRK